MRSPREAAILALVLVMLTGARPVQAGGVVGNGTPASCSDAALRAALTGGGSVTFKCGPDPLTITLVSPLVIDTATSLDADNIVTLSGGDAGRIFQVNAGASLLVRRATLSHGRAAAGSGGAILNSGTLTLTQVSVTHSYASANGGAIYSTGLLALSADEFLTNTTGTGQGGAVAAELTGPLAISDTLFAGNQAQHSGGALSVQGTKTMTVSVTGSTFRANSSAQSGGAIQSNGVPLVVADSHFLTNHGQYGGAIMAGSGTAPTALALYRSSLEGNWATISSGTLDVAGGLMVEDSEFNDNRAQGTGGHAAAVACQNGAAVIRRSTFRRNISVESGAIECSYTSPLTLEDSTFLDNQADNTPASGLWGAGGAVLLRGQATLQRNSFLGNTSTGYGGAVALVPFSAGAVTIANSTFYNNHAGCGGAISAANQGPDVLRVTNSTLISNTATIRGAAVQTSLASYPCSYGPQNAGLVEFHNTVVAGQANNCWGQGITSTGHNVDSGTSCGFTGSGDLASTDPRLAAPADNGGYTWTAAPSTAASALIDGGDNIECPATAQRGVARPQGLRCDIGAYEWGGQPALLSLDPNLMRAGSPGFSLRVNGSGFVLGSRVLWNGTPRQTVFVNSGVLTALILPADVAAPGVAPVDVQNPGPDGTRAARALSFKILRSLFLPVLVRN